MIEKYKNDKSIIIAETDKMKREALVDMFESDYNVIATQNMSELGKALEQNANKILALIISVSSNSLKTFEDVGEEKYKKTFKNAPVVIINEDFGEEFEYQAIQNGVADVIRRPFNALIVKIRIRNIIEVYFVRNNFAITIEEQTTLINKQNLALRKQAERLKEDNIRVIDTLSSIVEFRNLESKNHIKRIKGYTRVLANYVAKSCPEYELTKEKVDIITVASALHDIGKISIPDSILLKPSKLTPDEYEVMKSHTTNGVEVIDYIGSFSGDDYYKEAYSICRHHHERYDGKGYPDNLKGEDIPISAQIVSIADVYDALVSNRVYKAAYSLDVAFDMLIRGEVECFHLR